MKVQIFLYALLAFTIVSPFFLWWCFLGVMNLARVEKAGKLTPIQYKCGVVFAAGSIMLDLWVNLTWGWCFLQFPSYKRLMLSARMDDLILNGNGFRKQLALGIVGNFLEPFDETGGHSTHGNKFPVW